MIIKITAFIGVLIILALSHFIPISNRLGYIDRGMSNLCVGYSGPNDVSIRIITGGFKDAKDFKPSKDAAAGSNSPDNPGCAEPVKLKTFLL